MLFSFSGGAVESTRAALLRRNRSLSVYMYSIPEGSRLRGYPRTSPSRRTTRRKYKRSVDTVVAEVLDVAHVAARN